MQGLAALGHTCLAIDLPGHGSTTVPAAAHAPAHGAENSNARPPVAPYGIEACANLVGEALQQSGVEQCVLVGYSLGARVALSLAVQQPHLVGQLALVSGTPGIKVRQSA